MQRFSRSSSSGSESGSVAGSLLVAHPNLLDPSFRKAVVFVASHDDKGALGFILNRPTGRTVGEIIPGEEALGPVAHLPVYLGGPVGRNQIVICIFREEPDGSGVTCSHNVSASDVEEFLTDGNSLVRAFIGYSGWSGGQLENEIEHDSWLVRQPAPGMVSEPDDGSLWSKIMSSLGAWGKFQAGAPDDLSLN